MKRNSIWFHLYKVTRHKLTLSLISAAKSTTEDTNDTSKQNSTSANVLNVPFRHVDVNTFFTDRNEVVERAIQDCTENLIKQNNEELVGSWLLTEYVLLL